MDAMRYALEDFIVFSVPTRIETYICSAISLKYVFTTYKGLKLKRNMLHRVPVLAYLQGIETCHECNQGAHE